MKDTADPAPIPDLLPFMREELYETTCLDDREPQYRLGIDLDRNAYFHAHPDARWPTMAELDDAVARFQAVLDSR